jgi:hypothetical protein
MRLRKKMIDHVARTVTDRLLDQKLLTVDSARETVMASRGAIKGLAATRTPLCQASG